MPGLLTSMFADDQPEGTTSGEAQSYDVAADQAVDLSPDVGVGVDMGGSYQNLDGSTTTWSSDTDVNLSVDVDATLGAAGSLGQSSVEEG